MKNSAYEGHNLSTFIFLGTPKEDAEKKYIALVATLVEKYK